ncbi:hypothetical protein CWB73_02235 [Pseudoalteromonas phenolica]|uniref:Uncharacterized protein n=1 Tax=Pseudoalteromonas phenolica TaxID=161398 RepID=A0A5S3YYY9_9GAMM|nr:hypothetical protein [Pseudoalteromonas phenolica]TMP83311.1 hypothetical protein CWB73_02235 [Pseudoalteromonas phenolica]
MIIIISLLIALLIWALGLRFWGSGLLPHTLTIRELIITVLCSISPIILDCLIGSWFTKATFVEIFTDSFSSGQVFLYTSAYLAAFFIFYIKDNSKPPGFILSIVLFAGIAGALLYTFEYSTNVLNLKSYAPSEIINLIELLIVFFVFIAWYWSTLPNNKKTTSGANESEQQQNDLENKYNNLKADHNHG